MSLKAIVNTPDLYSAFTEYVQKKIDLHQRSLEQSTDIVDIYRLQGQITALRRLLTMREEVNNIGK